MKSKVRFSMKIKILLLMIVLILSSLGAYLYFALDLFNKDKNAYIYDSGLSTAESMGDQLLSMINHNAQNSFSLSLIGKNNPQILEEVITVNNDVMLFAIYQRELDQVKVEKSVINDRIEDLFGITKQAVYRVNELKIFDREEFKKKDLIIENTTQLIGFPSVSIVFYNKDLQEYYMTILSLGKVIDQFNQGSIYTNKLFDNSGREYQNSKGKKLEGYIRNILKGKVLAGSMEGPDQAGRTQLVSFKKIPNLNFNIISTIDKEKAFRANKSFIIKTILLGILLISLSILIGYIFSTGITNPIDELVKATEKVAGGDYESEIKINTNDELKLLSNSFNSMSGEISKKIGELKEANTKLEDYSLNLEKMVETRTVELKEANTSLDTMINSLGQGLFVFDKQGECSDIYTKVCEDIFKVKPSEHKAANVIGLSGDEEVNFERWSTNLFKETIPFEHLTGLGPKSKPNEKKPGEEGYEHISLEYFPIRTEQGSISKVVTVATDKTNEMLNQVRFEKERAEVERIKLLVENKKQFLSFIDEFKVMLHGIAKLANQDDLFDHIDSVMASLHSMKGGAGLFALKEIHDEIHHFEDEILNAQKMDDPTSYTSGFQGKVLRVSELFDNFLTTCRSFIGEEVVDGKHRIEFKLSEIEDFKKKMKKLKGSKLEDEFSNTFLKEPIINYFKSYSKLVSDLAGRLGKNIAPVEFKNGDLRIEHKRHKEFFNMLVHVFRNSIDHGVEDEMTRVTREKNPEGNIKVDFSTTEVEGREFLSVEISDDGNGIDVDRIRQIMIDKGQEDYIKEMSDEQISMLIFDSNLSTAEVVSDISGRGVGMSAVKDLVSELGGSIYLKSELEKGTQFRFLVPNV